MARTLAPAVTFVVPTRNAARTLGACLRSLRHQAGPAVELVVVDNHSSDDTARIASEYADAVLIAGPERSAQRNLGALIARAPVVVFVDADMVLEPTVAAQIVDAFAADAETGALVIPELAFGEHFLARCRALEKRLYLGDEGVEAARAFRREVFDAVGGWDESLTAGEDWDLTDRVRRSGAGVGRIEARIWHDERSLRLADTFRKKRYYGTWVASYLDRPGGSRRLARTSLVSKPRELAAEPAHAAGLVVLKAVEGAGLALGIAEGRRRQRAAAGAATVAA